MDNFSFTIKINGVDTIITSVAEANKVIKKLTEEIITAKEAGTDFSQALGQLNKALQIKSNIMAVSSGAVNLSSSLSKSQTASANAAQALLNLNYVIRDSPYFFQNFALGVLAVGNNLNPLIDSISRLSREASEKGVSSINLLKQALVGGAGLSIAFSVVVTAIQAYVFWLNRSKDSTNELASATSTLIELQNRFKDFRFILTPDEVKRIREQVKGSQTGLKSILSTTNYPFGELPQSIMSAFDIYPLAGKKLREMYETNKAITDEIDKQLNTLEAQARIWERMKELGAKETSLKSDNVAKEQENLLNKLILLQKEYREKELEELRQKYEEWVRIARNNHKLLLLAEETYRYQKKKINDEWDNKEIKFLSEKTKKEAELIPMKEPPKAQTRFVDQVKPVWWFDVEAYKKSLEEAKKKEILLKSASDMLGDSLMSAFMKGKFALDEFLGSLAIAVGKFLLLQAISAAFGLPSIFSPSAVLSTGAGAAAAAMPKINVNVGGIMKMNGRDFVIQFKRIENGVLNSRI